MPFLTNLLLYRQTGQRKRRMHRALCLLEYGTDQMINGRLFLNVPSLCTTSRQGYLGHARPPISRRFWLRPLTGGRQLRQTGAGGKAHLTAKKRRQTRGSV